MKPNLTARSSYNKRKSSNNFKYVSMKRKLQRNKNLNKMNNTYTNFTKNKAPLSG